MKDILQTITALRQARGWSEYQLAEHSGIPQSTISGWYRKQSIPETKSLIKICNTFGITMSQLFSEGKEAVMLTDQQERLLHCFSKLEQEKQAALLTFLEML